MEIKLDEFNEIVEFVKKHDGRFTKEELWAEYIKPQKVSQKEDKA